MDVDLVSLVDELEASEERQPLAGKAGSVAGSTRSVLSSLGQHQPFEDDQVRPHTLVESVHLPHGDGVSSQGKRGKKH
jgi:hypothetical protein